MQAIQEVRRLIRALPTVSNLSLSSLPDPREAAKVMEAIRLCHRPDFSKNMDNMCSDTSPLIAHYLNGVFSQNDIDGECIVVDAGNGAHEYNLVRLRSDILIVDASAAQFISNPLQAFEDTFAFVGTRVQLKSLITRCMRNTRAYVRQIPLITAGMKLAEIEQHAFGNARCSADKAFEAAVTEMLKAPSDKPRIRHLIIRGFWKNSWGDISHFRPFTSYPDEKHRSVWERELVCKWDQWRRCSCPVGRHCRCG